MPKILAFIFAVAALAFASLMPAVATTDAPLYFRAVVFGLDALLATIFSVFAWVVLG